MIIAIPVNASHEKMCQAMRNVSFRAPICKDDAQVLKKLQCK